MEDNTELLDNIKMALKNKYIILTDTDINENINLAKIVKFRFNY